MSEPSPTPNLKLQPISANHRVWAEIMNGNLTLLDAVVGTYFVVQNLQGAWTNSIAYGVGDSVVDSISAVVYQCQVAHTSSNIPTTFAQERAAHSTYWSIYSSPARSRGVWVPDTSYALNDFVVSGAQYAICVQTHVSSSSFAADLAGGKWSVLVDLSSAGSTVLPSPGGIADANKVTTTNAAGTGYTILSISQFLTLLGATSIGIALLGATSQAVALSAIGAQPAGSYQPLDASLTTLATFTIGAFADDLLACADAAAVRAALALSTLATTTPAANVATFLANPTSANLAAALSNETGTGLVVFNDSPTLTGSPAAPTQTAADNSTKLATTAYVDKGLVQQTVVQFDSGYTTTAGNGIPCDNSIPQIGEGDEYSSLNLSITAKSVTSVLEFDIQVVLGRGSADMGVLALFKTGTSNALKAVPVYIPGPGISTIATLKYRMAAGTLSSQSFTVRVGSNTPAAIAINGTSAGAVLGNVCDSHMIIREYGV